ncbi:3162_t:CDS:1, partial [Entrophospora sp. SA101]
MLILAFMINSNATFEARSVELVICILALHVTFEFEDEARCAETVFMIWFFVMHSNASFEARSAEIVYLP